MAGKNHVWQIFRMGGSNQVMLKSGDDIANLAGLDQKLWAALSCPVTGIRFDAKTLQMLDADHDQRVRVPEILAAVDWMKVRLTSLDSLLIGTDKVQLSAINGATPEGEALLANVKRILKDLGRPEASEITLSDLESQKKAFADTPFNGDGILPPDSVSDEALRQTVADIIATVGGVTDVGGKTGVDQAKVDEFFAAVKARLAWQDAAKEAGVLPLADGTAKAAAAVKAVESKFDDYFARCGLVAFDGRAQQPLDWSEGAFAALTDKSLTTDFALVKDLPLARPVAGGVIDATTAINPYWAAAVAEFRSAVMEPMGIASLAAAEWQRVKATFAPYFGWQGGESGKEIAALDADRLAKLAAGDDAAKLAELIAKDAALAPEYAKLVEVEQLIRYHANLLELLNNMVNMGKLYDPNAWPVFRVGTLYLDGRACSLCFQVADAGAHSAQADASKCCLVYCSISRPGSGDAGTICAPVTAGVARTLYVGRNGVFYDVDGKDWEAKVVKLVDHAISLKEAFWSPWRKIVEALGNQINKFLASKQDAAVSNVTANVNDAAAAPAAAPKKLEGAALASSVAVIGIAIGAIGSAIGALLQLASGLPWWKSLLGVAAVILVVSLPSVALTWFKLRSRDLAPILNACGWAINHRLGFSLKLGRLFTSEAKLPEDAKRNFSDPYADSKPWGLWLLLLLAAAAALWYFVICPRYCGGCNAKKDAPAEAVAPTADAAAPAAPAAK